MADVDIGLRILLQDLASGGLNGFKGVLQDLVQFASAGGLSFKNFSGEVNQLESAIASSEAKLAEYGNTMQLLQLKNDAAVASLAATKIEMEAIGNLPTQNQINGLTKEIDLWQTELAASNQQLTIWQGHLADSGGTSQLAAEKVALYEAEVAKLSTSIDDAKAKIQLLTDQGLLQQEAALKRSEAAAMSAQQNVDKLAASTDAETASLVANKDALVATTEAQAAANVQQQLMLTGVGLLAGGGIGLGLLGSVMNTVVKDASSLQDAMAGLKIAFNLTDAQTNDMSATLSKVASSSRFSLTEVADAFTMLGEHGRSADEVIKQGIGQSAINMAEAMNTQAVPAAKLLSDTMTTFGAKASEASNYADMLTYAFYHGIPDVNGLQTAIQDVGGTAAMMHVPFDQLVSVMDFLAKSGMSASMASTSLRYMLTSLQDPTSKASKALTDMGILTINSTTPAFKQFTAQLDATVGSAKAATFDGTLTSLQAMFTQAQKAHVEMATTDKSFISWATSLGLVSSSLVDTNGNVKDLFSVLAQLGDKLKGLPQDEKLKKIQDVFNIKSGQDAQHLLDDIDGVMGKLKTYDQQIKDFEKQGGTAKDAAIRTGTESGQKAKADTTITSLLGQAGQPLVQWLGDAYNNLNHLVSGLDGSNPKVQQAAMIFGAVAGSLSLVAVIAGIVAIAMTAVVAPFLPIIGIVLGVVAGIALLSVGIAIGVTKFKEWYNSTGPIQSTLKHIGQILSDTFGKTFHSLFNSIGSTWNQLNGHFTQLIHGTTNVQKTFKDFSTAVQPVIRALTALGGVIVAILGGVFMGIIHGAVTAAVTFFHGLMNIFLGVMQIVTGFINIFGGIGKAFNALLHGDMKGFQAGMMQAWTGLVQVVAGIWHAILGLFMATIGTIIALVAGFIWGIISWFMHLAEVLYKHSIIPDMWNAILNIFIVFPQRIIAAVLAFVFGLIAHFIQLAVQVTAAAFSLWNMVQGAFNAGVGTIVNLVASLPGRILGFLSGLGGSMFNSALNAMNMFANGISSGISNVMAQAGNVAASVKHVLGFASPPKGGPLADSDKYMGNMMRMFGQGILSNQHHVSGAVNTVATMMNKGFQTPLTQAAGGAFASAGGAGGNTVLQVTLDGKVLGEAAINHATGQMKMTGMNRRMR